MRRKESWPEDMNKFIAANRFTPFVWGKFDCCLMVADCMKAMTGEDFAQDYRGKYSDQDGAMAVLTASAGSLERTLEGLHDAFGWQEVENLNYMQRADICLLSSVAFHGFGGMLGIHLGEWVGVMGEEGMLFTSPKHVSRAWRVPS